jgi:uncharacterized protein YfaS (alpha-2-macroglobulin family)
MIARRLIHIFFLGILAVLLFSGCHSEIAKERLPEEYSLETAQTISHATSGVISAQDYIRIRFTGPMVPAGRVGMPLEERLFIFNPRIEGTAQWEDRQTLAFIPGEDLPRDKDFSAVLELATIMPYTKGLYEKGEKQHPFPFHFRTAAREVVRFRGDFMLKNTDDPHSLSYKGTMSFTEPVSMSLLEKSVVFYLRRESESRGRKMSVVWEKGKNDKEFLFIVSGLVREDCRQIMQVQARGPALGLSIPFEQSAILESVSTFAVTDVIPCTDGRNPEIIVKFSDPLSLDQDLAGLIRTEPYVDVSLSTAGNTVFVTGDLEYGETYRLIASNGIRSESGTETENTEEFTILEDIKPQMQFLQSGVFLPTTGNRKIYFKTVNLRQVKLDVKRVFENNLGQFLQTERLSSSRDRNERFSSRYINRVGISVASESFLIGDEKNVWLNHELDLRSLIRPTDKGLYIVSLNFEREDMIYNLDEEPDYYWGDDYYSNPNSYGYLYAHGRIYKPVITSNIGLTWKAGKNQQIVLATNLIDTEPAAGVEVSLLSYQNQLIARTKTLRNGKAVFNNVNQNVFYVTGEKDGQRSVIKANEMSWNLSTFDTRGEDVGPEGIRAYLFTERGVYRPGDMIYLSAVIRNRNESFPGNHPVALKLFNPLNQVVYEEINTEGKDGFYGFTLSTGEDDPTGSWKVEIAAGSRLFYKTIRIETIVPYRLKVLLTSEKEKLENSDRTFSGRLESTYLFGAPASNLEASVEASLESWERNFPGYPGFRFTNEAVDYKPAKSVIFEGSLDEEGKANISWYLPPFTGAPSALKLVLSARVFEKGGRAVRKVLSLPVEAYSAYVGLAKPEMKWGYAQIGSALKVPYIVAGTDGRAVSGRSLRYRIYKNTTYWWWEYDSHADFRLRYKSDSQTELVDEGVVISRGSPSSIEFKPEAWGEYLLEVEDEGGHTAGFFFRASRWGQQASVGEDGGNIVLNSDKSVYHPGDKAIISFPSSKEGKLLVTVEKAYDILSAEWYPLQDSETRVSISITDDMVPNAYVTVSLIQPHAQTLNDRPIRMYGVIPLNVEKKSTRQGLEITVPDEISPNEDFQVVLQTKDRKPAQFILAVVDEGLLDITAFATPDPWKAFYAKQRLGVVSYDLFSQVIGAHKGDIFKTFSVGGGDEELLREEPGGKDKKRFPPVVLFHGPAFTDERGKAKVDFTMPNYMGAVRIMAVSASGESYGSKDKTVPVRSDLILLPTLPRVLGPAEEIRIPVTLFALKEQLGKVTVRIESEGPVTVEGSKEAALIFNSVEERELEFGLATLAAVGKAKITITAESRYGISESVTNIDVRASSPPLYKIERKATEPGTRVVFRIPDDGMDGTNRARLSISRRGDLDLNKRLRWLIHYPYGCIEQTTSAVFPQLYLKDVVETGGRDEAAIDANINAGIDRLRKFQLPSGGFSFWPGSSNLSIWGTSYAGHFMLEAEKQGYPVPQDMKERWLLFQNSKALSTADDLMTRVYRIYLLALAGKPAYGPMNLLKENHLYEMSNPQKWLLAAAYKLTGMRETADSILVGAGFSVKPYSEFAGTYGSALRDRAIILDMAVQLSLWDTADKLYEEIAERLGSDDWYSTQTLGYSLLAVGKYIGHEKGEEQPLLKGRIIHPDGEIVSFSTKDFAYKQEIEQGFGKSLIVSIDEKTTLRRVHMTLEWEGVPLISEEGKVTENIGLSLIFYDENGTTIGPAAIRQGSTFWARFRVNKTAPYRINLEELALTQIIPSGWEIENLRLTGEAYPEWMKNFRLGTEEYMDIRDDRISWFFDMPGKIQTLDFVMKLQAVTEGSFHLPPAVCEAMYRHDFRALFPGRTVRVEGRD